MLTNDKIFGEKVKFSRNKKGWKQETLADQAALSQPEISKIEKGHGRGIREDTIRKL